MRHGHQHETHIPLSATPDPRHLPSLAPELGKSEPPPPRHALPALSPERRIYEVTGDHLN